MHLFEGPLLAEQCKVRHILLCETYVLSVAFVWIATFVPKILSRSVKCQGWVFARYPSFPYLGRQMAVILRGDIWSDRHFGGNIWWKRESRWVIKRRKFKVYFSWQVSADYIYKFHRVKALLVSPVSSSVTWKSSHNTYIGWHHHVIRLEVDRQNGLPFQLFDGSGCRS